MNCTIAWEVWSVGRVSGPAVSIGVHYSDKNLFPLETKLNF